MIATHVKHVQFTMSKPQVYKNFKILVLFIIMLEQCFLLILKFCLFQVVVLYMMSEQCEEHTSESLSCITVKLTCLPTALLLDLFYQ